MEEVSRKINDEHWEANAVLSTKLEIFTYAQCYGFLSHKDCLSCYSETRTRLPKCLPSNLACIYLDGCFFRYDTYNFFKESLNEKHDYVKCSLPTNVSKDVYMGKEFQEKVFKVIENVTDLEVLNKGFALLGERGLEAVYAMAQCWMTDCLALLHLAMNNSKGLTRARGTALGESMVCQYTHVNNSRDFWQGDHPLDNNTSILLVEIIMIFIVLGFTFIVLRPLRQPKIIIQIVAGIIMGPTLLGQSKVYVAKLFPPGARLVLLTFAEFGFMIHLFLLGLQIDTSLVKSIGRKVMVIALTGTIIPLLFGVAAYKITEHANPSEHALVLLILITINALTPFIDITSLLNEINILNSEIGRFASSMSLVSDASGWLLAFILRNIGAALKYSTTEPLSIIATVVGYYFILIFLMRPLVIWIDSFMPKNRPNEENHFIAILCIVLVNGFFAEYIGEHAHFGTFVLGLSLPNGPTLGATIIQKLEALCTGLLLPIYCVTSGFKTQLSSIANMSVVKTELIIFAGYFGKFIGTILPSIYFKIPFKESLTLALIMCCKGVIEITIFRVWHDNQFITTQTYTLLIFSMIMATGLATIFIRHLYDPSARYMADTRRTITNSAQNSGLRMLVCIHSEENVSSFTNLIEVSNPTKENPIFVCVLQLIEIKGQAASILVKLDKQNNLLASNLDYSGQISNAFDHYENYSEGSVKIQNFKAIAPCASMHDDICTLAMDQKTSIIIVPFHKTWGIDGTIEANIPFLRTINKNVLKKAPCSIGVLVDRGEIGRNLSILTGNSSYLIAMLFIGGADDREALAYSIRMAGHPNVNLTVVQLIASSYNTSNYQNNLDKEAMDELWASINRNQKIKHEKETVRHGADTTLVIQKMANNFDLVIVGRYHEPHSPVTLGLIEWSKCPELGVLGDVLASSSFRFSVLVVQHNSLE